MDLVSVYGACSRCKADLDESGYLTVYNLALFLHCWLCQSVYKIGPLTDD